MAETPDNEPLRDAEHLDELPIDSDIEVDDISAARPARPVHLRLQYIGIVFLGGAIGTGARAALSLATPSLGAFPMAIFIINITGSFALGIALEILLRLGPDEGHRRRLRLFIGTGIIGGYTTYSTFAVGTVEAFTAGHPYTAVIYGLVSVVVGAAAGFAGIAVSAEAHRWATTPKGQRR